MAHKYSSAPTLVNPRAALRSVGTVVVVVACKAHAHVVDHHCLV